MKRFMLIFAFVFLMMLILAETSYLYASGFFLYHQDTKAEGMAGAFTAQADNPSAIYYNPAGMSYVDGTQISIGSRFFRLETEYKNLLGQKEDLEAKWEPVPNAFITSDLGTEKLTVGLGIFAPFGLSTKWSDTGLLRYAATENSFKMVAINPSIAYQILPQLSVGAGIDYYNVYSYTSEYLLNLIILDSPVKLDVNGDGWGFNLGALWKPHEKHSLGVAYRSKADVSLGGDLKLTGFGLLTVYDTKEDLTLPGILSAGYAFRPVEKLKLEADINWVQLSTIDKIDIKEKNTGIVLSSVSREWEDAWIFALGGEYYLNDMFTLRAGYSFQQNAVPEKTFIPDVPDSDLNIIALGLGWNISKNLVVDLAYGIGFYDKRDIDNNVGAIGGTTVDGSYDSLIHVIGLTAGLKF